MTHLRLAHASEATLRRELETLVRATPFLIGTLQTVRTLNLPDCWLVAGAVYNRVWNHLTDRPARHGIKDIDLFYFDPDTSWQAEDDHIKRAAGAFAADPPVELRNQARVHLWYEDRFGQPYSALKNARQGIDRFACKTHAVGLQLDPSGALSIYAPFGLRDIFAFRITPNPVLDKSATHDAKAARQKEMWPELTVLPWPHSPA